MNYCILGFDIENYSGTNSSEDMFSYRSIMRNIITQSFYSSEIRKTHVTDIDTGDGTFIFFDTNNIIEILKLLDSIRIISNNKKSIKFRSVLHYGDCEKDTDLFTKDIFNKEGKINIIGNGINSCARYLNSQDLKENLLKSDEYFCYGLSCEVYDMIKHNQSFDKNSFLNFDFSIKNFKSKIYIKKKIITKKINQ